MTDYERAYETTPHNVLIKNLMNPNIPKTEMEHAACREIGMLREALRTPAQTEQEPVAWYDSITGQTDFSFYKPHRKPSSFSAEWIPLYTTPPQRPWVGLTEEEVNDCIKLPNRNLFARDGTTSQRIARAIEAKLRDKNL